jgi:hypothetical protein
MDVRAAEVVTALVVNPIICDSCVPSSVPDVCMGFWNVSSADIMKLRFSAAV